MGGRLNVDFKSRLKFDLFLRSYIYSERGDFAASFYNKNSILVFFPKWSIFGGGGALIKKKHRYKSRQSNKGLEKKKERNYRSFIVKVLPLILLIELFHNRNKLENELERMCGNTKIVL